MEIVETEDGNCYVSQSHALFCEESLGKIDAEMSNFRERVGPRILLLESVDYFGTSESFTENFDGKAINWLGVCKLSLYENESCDEHAVYFWR